MTQVALTEHTVGDDMRHTKGTRTPQGTYLHETGTLCKACRCSKPVLHTQHARTQFCLWSQ